MADAAPPAAPAPVSVNDALELCTRVYGAAGDWARQRGQARWVMNLAWYRQVRAASETVTGNGTDPDTWTPDPGDTLFGIPVSVRDDGEEPHLEMTGDGPSPASPADPHARVVTHLRDLALDMLSDPCDLALAIARSILAPPPLDCIADGLHDEVMTAGQLRALLAGRDAG